MLNEKFCSHTLNWTYTLKRNAVISSIFCNNLKPKDNRFQLNARNMKYMKGKNDHDWKEYKRENSNPSEQTLLPHVNKLSESLSTCTIHINHCLIALKKGQNTFTRLLSILMNII